MKTLCWTNVALRGLLEAGIVVALGYWGATRGGPVAGRIVLALAAPGLAFGFWGAVDFRRMGAAAEFLRLAQELAISGLAVMALWVCGAPRSAWALAGLSVVHHALVYLTGSRLLKV